MKKSYLAALFVGNLVGWTIGNGLLPVLPVYAAERNINPTQTGIYLALGYIALMIGTVVAGYISDRWLLRQRLLLGVGLALVPSLWLMGPATQYWTILLITCLVWFFGGMSLALLSILAGLLADPAKRGSIFGILALTSALGALLGGVTIGPIADRWGFGTLFIALALFTLLLPGVTLILPEVSTLSSKKETQEEERGSGKLPQAFVILMVAVVFGSCARFIGQLATSLLMHDQSFNTSAISGTAAVGGAVTIPFVLALGWLADRYSRKLLLATCYVAGIIGFVILAGSATLWQYWLSAIFLAILGYGTIGVGSALVSDIVPKAALGRGLAMFNGLTLAGGIVGFAATGFILQTFGATAVFGLGVLLSLSAGLILTRVRLPKQQTFEAGVKL